MAMPDKRPTPAWLSLWIKLALLAAWCDLAARLVGWPGLLISGVCGLAIILPRYILEGSGSFADWAKERALKEWDGEYLQYDGMHLRAWRIDGELWLSAHDLATALQLEHFDARKLATRLSAASCSIDDDGHDLLLNEAGVREWIAPMESRDSAKFRLWLERNVLLVESERRRRHTMAPRS